MNTEASPGPRLAVAQADLAWRIVGLTNGYRLLAVPVLLAVHLITPTQPVFGQHSPPLFRLALACYFLLAMALALAGRHQQPRRQVLVFTQLLVDSAAVALMMYASGGVASNLGILLVVPTGSMALLAVGPEALVLAAIASLAILGQQIAAQVNGIAPASDYPLAGVMGTVLFLVAGSSWIVASRLRESEAQVRRQEIDLANLAQLSQYIVQRLRESILVVDPGDRIRLINESAAQLLGPSAVPGALLGEVSPRLLYLIGMWRRREAGQEAVDTVGTFASADGTQVLEPHFAMLGSAEPAPLLVFLEDTGALAAQVQQSKLASLGRLTASIAHEIRNPVGAMSHAAQLLAEASGLGAGERRMTEIIHDNAQRVSSIIENVQRLSRRDPPRPEALALGPWCTQFCAEFCATTQAPREAFQVEESEPGIEALADPSQLHQIVWNLCENALRHGSESGRPGVELRIARLPRSGRACLEVADHGPGIDPQDVERVFEPFYTRAARGTGLGLFLARELAEINGATLLYEARRGGGSIFRLVFADPTRWHATAAAGRAGG